MIRVDKSMVHALVLAERWCREHGRQSFKMGDIRHLLTHTQYCTFNNWMRVSSGLVYSPNHREYAINRARFDEFMQGHRTVHDVVIDPITRQITNAQQYYVQDIPGIYLYMEDGEYKVEFIERK